MARKWVCQTYPDDASHQFDQCSEDGFCTECPKLNPPEMGILVLTELGGSDDPSISIDNLVNNQKFVAGSPVSIHVVLKSGNKTDVKKTGCFVNNKSIGEATQLPATFKYASGEKGTFQVVAKAYGKNGQVYSSETIAIIVNGVVTQPDTPIGLSVILMDASSSMTEQAFDKSPLTRLRLVATSAAMGIFDLERMQNNPNAYVAAFKFDDRIELMFIDTVANLLKRFDNDYKKFANYIHDELSMMLQGTDINKALSHAHNFIDSFLNKKLPEFPLKKYSVMMQRILTHEGESVLIPNIRVLIYTDGMQYDAQSNKQLYPNPFKQNPVKELNHDILIGAFFGQQQDDGCDELRGLLSRCPIHDVEQFFLFDNPGKIGNLKFLFRMASGASGFCPKCLEKQLTR